MHINLQYSKLQWLWQYTPQLATNAKISGSSYDLPHLPIIATLALEDAAYQWNGRLARYDGAGVNAATRTVPCVAIVEERTPIQIDGEGAGNIAAPPALLRGMFVTIQIKIDPQRPLLAVPASAVRPGDRVWVLRDGKLEIEQLDVVMTVDRQALILADQAPIREGDQIITSPLPMAVVGMPLRKANPKEAHSAQPTHARGS